MKKRFLSILTALALCLTLLPTSALAEGIAEGTTEPAADSNPFTITKNGNPAEVTTDYTWDDTATDGGGNTNTVNMLTIKTSGLTVANTNPETNASAQIKIDDSLTEATLTLNGVNITAPGSSGALNTTGTLTINLADGSNNTLTGGSDGDNGSSYGIYAAGALTINGTGTLRATGGAASGSGKSVGISSDTSITIDGGTVDATGGSSGATSFGIYASNGSSNATITIKAGNVTATGGQATNASCGISADGEIKIENGTVIATGGTVTDTSNGNRQSYGIRSALSNITITGGTGTAKTTENESSTAQKGAMKTAPSFGNDAKVGSKQANTAQSMSWGPVPSITTQPTAQTVTAGSAATFTVAAENASSYKWQVKKGEAEWADVDGATAASYTTGATTVDMNGNQYRCIVGNEYKDGVTSNAATLTVQAATDPGETSYTVTVNGGTGGGEYATGDSVTITATVPSGKKFVSWTVTPSVTFTSGGTNTATATFTMPTEAVTVTAAFQDTTPDPVKYTVKFDSNGGSYVAPQTVEEGKTAAEPDEPTMRGWRFRGWYLGGEWYDFSTPVNGDITLVAKWSGGNSGGGNGGGNESETGNSGNGNSGVTEKNPDGSTTTTTEKKDGTVIEETQHPDGTEVTVETKPDGTVTEETKRPDGSTTVIEKQPDGTVTTTDKDKEGNKTEVVEKPDGSSTTTVEKVDGTITITVVEPDGTVISQVELTKKALEGKETVEIPMPALPTSNDRETAPVVTLAVPKGVSVKVEVPVENPTPGTVAIIVHEDGREEIIRSSIATDNGVALTIAGSTTVKIVDNSKDFQDVAPTSWAADSVDFVTARELFSGISETDFAPAAPMTRQMLMTVLARLDGVDTTADPYGLGMTWAVGKNISDGSDPTGTISREELAVMLWRYAGGPMLMDYEGLDQFTDVADLALWAQQAMVWAHAEGIITGTTDTTLDPQGEATRAHVAAMIQRYCEGR